MTKTAILFEACVTSLDDAVRAEREGAGRIELCGWEAEGGTSPSAALIKETCGRLTIPVFAFIRPRGGDYVYSSAELDGTVGEIGAAKGSGAAGIVAGALLRDGSVDEAATARLIAAARPLPFTFHRAFDEVPDPTTALDVLIGLGVDRVLTAGGRGTAEQGIPVLRGLVARGGGRIAILAGGGVRGHNVSRIVRETGVREVHAKSAAGPIVAALRT